MQNRQEKHDFTVEDRKSSGNLCPPGAEHER